MENVIIKMGFIELITEHAVGLGPPLSRLSRHSRWSVVRIICNDDITPQLCDSCLLVGGEHLILQRIFAVFLGLAPSLAASLLFQAPLLLLELQMLRGQFSERKWKQLTCAATHQFDRTAGIQPTLESEIT